MQPRRQHWFLNKKSGFPLRTPAFCSVSKGQRRLGEKEYRAPSAHAGGCTSRRNSGCVRRGDVCFCRLNAGIGASLDGLGLLSDCGRLEFGLFGLVPQCLHLIPNSAKLILHRIGLPFSLGGEFGQVADSGLDIGSISGIAVGHVGDHQGGEADKERQPFIGSKASQKISGWGAAVYPAFVGSIGGACLMAAQCGRDFDLSIGQRVRYRVFGMICLLTAWPVCHFAAPMVGP